MGLGDKRRNFGISTRREKGTETRDKDGLAGGADSSLAGIREADDLIGMVVADGHEEALLLRMIEEMVAPIAA